MGKVLLLFLEAGGARKWENLAPVPCCLTCCDSAVLVQAESGKREPRSASPTDFQASGVPTVIHFGATRTQSCQMEPIKSRSASLKRRDWMTSRHRLKRPGGAICQPRHCAGPKALSACVGPASSAACCNLIDVAKQCCKSGPAAVISGGGLSLPCLQIGDNKTRSLSWLRRCKDDIKGVHFACSESTAQQLRVTLIEQLEHLAA